MLVYLYALRGVGRVGALPCWPPCWTYKSLPSLGGRGPARGGFLLSFAILLTFFPMENSAECVGSNLWLIWCPRSNLPTQMRMIIGINSASVKLNYYMWHAFLCCLFWWAPFLFFALHLAFVFWVFFTFFSNNKEMCFQSLLMIVCIIPKIIIQRSSSGKVIFVILDWIY